MPASVRDNYLEAEILTASPQKLHLMLIEGAIRFIERTRIAWQEENWDVGCETLIRSQQIIAEILAGLNPNTGGDLPKKVAALYIWMYRTLIEAGASRDQDKLREVVRVLEIERETWRQLCEQLGDTRPEAAVDEAEIAETRPADQAPAAPPLDVPPTLDEYAGGFSLDA
ncbi:hypothetical protein JCM19992_02020 [Thermostilla marina]